jgi:hypothetical protein
MKRFVLGALAAAAAIAAASPAMAQGGPGCSRERLVEIANQYRAAQADGRAIMHMIPMGEWVNYYENYELSSMAFGGVIASPQRVDWDRSFYDTANCSVFVESIITDPAHPFGRELDAVAALRDQQGRGRGRQPQRGDPYHDGGEDREQVRAHYREHDAGEQRQHDAGKRDPAVIGHPRRPIGQPLQI